MIFNHTTGSDLRITMDVQEELNKLATLPNQAWMVTHLQKIDENITNEEDKIQLTGTIASLTANYRAYLEGAVGAEGEVCFVVATCVTIS
jgi:Fe-S cluster assembly ATPase SufC